MNEGHNHANAALRTAGRHERLSKCRRRSERNPVDASEWTPFQAVNHHDGKTLLSLALYVASAQGLDLDDVTVVRGVKTDGS